MEADKKKKKKSKQPYKITASHIKIARKKMQIMDDREGMTLGEEGLRRWPQVSVIVMLSQQPRLEEVLGQVQTITTDMLTL